MHVSEREQRVARAASMIVAAVVGAALGLAAIVVLGNGPANTPRLASSAAGASAAPAEVEPSPVAAVRPESEPPADEATPAATDGRHAEPPDDVGAPVRVRIPAIDVDTDLVGLGLNDDQSMETPDFGHAGWYELGPEPGAAGPAVIAAHVDSVDGPDVFFRLRELTAGDEIIVDHAAGGTTTFVVHDSEQQLKEELPVDRIWNDTDEVVLRLVTCGGDFDRDARSYESNVIVYARAQTT